MSENHCIIVIMCLIFFIEFTQFLPLPQDKIGRLAYPKLYIPITLLEPKLTYIIFSLPLKLNAE